jgi:glycosyltransferase involved in cell wall biosynthesis
LLSLRRGFAALKPQTGYSHRGFTLIIAIDGIALSNPQPGGYRTYVSNLVSHLRLIDEADHFQLLVDRPIPWDPLPNWSLSVLSRRGSLGFIWREQIGLHKFISRCKADVLHSPATTAPLWPSLPLLVTLYDTIEFSESLPPARELRRWGMRLYSRFVQQGIARKADRILTISEYSKSQIAKFFGIPLARIAAISLAPSPIYRPLNREIAVNRTRQQYGISHHVMAFASAAKRKNILALLEAYVRIGSETRSRHPLALVCTHRSVKGEMLKATMSMGIEHDCVLIEQPSDDDLVHLYNAAALFVFPSLKEGFGLPPVEAMACGTPVVASNTSSMPEVLGDAALLVPPTEADAIADAMASVLTSRSLSESLRERGLERSSHFSWHKTAYQTLTAYRSLSGW